MKKKILAAMLAVALVQSSLAVATPAYAAEDNQVSRQGAVVRPETGNVVVMEQTAQNAVQAGKPVENLFDVTTTVTTTEDIQNIPVSPDADIVLVMDVSNSMEEIINGKTRIAAAKDTAKQFIGSFAADLPPGVSRNVAVVSFGTAAVTVSGWADVTKPQNVTRVLDDIDTYLNTPSGTQKFYSCGELGEHHHGTSAGSAAWHYNGSLSCRYPGCPHPSEPQAKLYHQHFTADENLKLFNLNPGDPPVDGISSGGGTNITSGLLLARNLLKQKSSKNRYVILMTDGVPTYSIWPENKDYGSTLAIDGEYGPGNSAVATDTYALICNDIRQQAKKLTNDMDVRLFSVAFSADSEKIPSVGTIRELLKPISNQYFPANNADELANAFASVNESIRYAAQAWIVDIPLDNRMEFVDFQSNQGATTLSHRNGKICWDIKKDIPVVSGASFTYTMTYRVRLNPDATGYRPGRDNAFPLSAAQGTTLQYLLQKDFSSGPITALRTARFDVPEVFGHTGAYAFTKISPEGTPLGGATFRLYNAGREYFAASGPDGKVVFPAIRSGESYLLEELVSPQGYTPSTTVHQVAVSFGRCTVSVQGSFQPDRLVSSGEYVNHPAGFITLSVPPILDFGTVPLPLRETAVPRTKKQWLIYVENTTASDNWRVTAHLETSYAQGASRLNGDALHIRDYDGSDILLRAGGAPALVLNPTRAVSNRPAGNYFFSQWGVSQSTGPYLLVKPQETNGLQAGEYSAVIKWTLVAGPTG